MFPVPGNVPKWTLSSITQASTKRQIIADQPSDAGETTPKRNFTAVPVTPRRTSKAKRQVVDLSDDKAVIMVAQNRSTRDKQMVDEDDKRNPSDSTYLQSSDSDSD